MREKSAELRRSRPQRRPEPVAVGVDEAAADRLDERQIRQREFGLRTGAREHGDTGGAGVFGELAG